MFSFSILVAAMILQIIVASPYIPSTNRIVTVYDGGDPSAMCPICRDRFVLGEVIRRWTPCGHTYHVLCMNRWCAGRQENNRNCPTCRATLNGRLAEIQRAQHSSRNSSGRTCSACSSTMVQIENPQGYQLLCQSCGRFTTHSD
ncbi:hypothetical protein PGTUg99_036669 [Puccinia graminis f. sp. tritici]|uniref:RING-type domain-containing protein n=2 Tax=Puccinia graminis f. sp. tritici TaxID=56615 RepID=H6QTX9_PUCGT|nr:uncharacterized protein PGTG_22224 [Puccinia graminis f. sp. tritici CRL 75-36-700-3]EHS64393.1 hypothetical protein PGTG_22224 [Puccinia graminis f. sp. tritici CRL 75-36-700-3]KAA1122328.1 hypothetical protein PGTUg99_036669 [Puccinia graminis f. sp. tritici]